MRITKVIVKLERMHKGTMQTEIAEHYVDTPNAMEAYREVRSIVEAAGWIVVGFKTKTCWLYGCK